MPLVVAVLVLLALLLVLPGGGGDASAGQGGKAEFLADCPFSHRVAADPIVHPGKRRAGHLHDFLGNRTTSGRSTAGSLRRGRTTCRPSADRSAYWVPTLIEDGRPLRPEQVTIYFTVEPELADRVRAFPPGLRMIAGNARERGLRPGAPNVWGCLGEATSGQDLVTCPAGSRLELLLSFPGCWDGRRTDSRDHQSHMAYVKDGRCPASHPVVVPEIEFKIRWPTRGAGDVALASGRGFTAHGDVLNAWDPAELERRIATCLRPVVKCGADGRPL